MPHATGRRDRFFEHADMLDTQVGQSKNDDPADVAHVGFDAMMRGHGDVVSGWKNKLQSAIANVTPAGLLAEQQFEWPSLAQRRSQLLLAGDRALRGLLALFAGLVFFALTRTMRVERQVPAAAVPDGLGAYHQAGSAEARALAPGRAQDAAVLVEGRRRS